jgi:hypothetical protein
MVVIMVNELEKKFDKDMINIYWEAKRELNYTASRFMQLILEKGGLRAAKQLITKDGGTSEFTTLYEMGRLDLSVEAHVLKPEYKELFTEEEREICRGRLKKYGYKA